MRGRVSSLLCAVLLGLPARGAHALPPPAAAFAASTVEAARWVQHRVIPGERLVEIAERYEVTVAELLEWNELDAKKLLLRDGQKLRVYTTADAVPRRRQRYTVRRGDSWARIAQRFDVSQGQLRRVWNPKQAELVAGDSLIVWVEQPARASESAVPEAAAAADDAKVPVAAKTTGGPAARASAPTPAPTPTPASTPAPSARAIALTPLPADRVGRSVGTPTRGRLVDGVQLPEQPDVYTIRTPEQTFGTTLAVTHLQRGLAAFRQDTGFDRELVVCDMSRERGGRFRPHRSHTSGRDVDIRLPLRRGVAAGTIPIAASLVDWTAAWQLVKSLIATGQVRYVFLARSRQRPLYEAARRAGESEESLAELMQYPRRTKTAVLRHSAGHTKHIHVRFRCGPDEPQCVDP